eukprot:gene57394-biopygen73619
MCNVQVRANSACLSDDTSLGIHSSLEQCSAACASATGCTFFIYGHGSKSGACYHEHTTSATCTEGWEDDASGFYENLHCPTSSPYRPGTPSGTPAVCVPYSSTACRNAALALGLSLGGYGYVFKDDYDSVGCYAYSCGTCAHVNVLRGLHVRGELLAAGRWMALTNTIRHMCWMCRILWSVRRFRLWRTLRVRQCRPPVQGLVSETG